MGKIACCTVEAWSQACAILPTLRLRAIVLAVPLLFAASAAPAQDPVTDTFKVAIGAPSTPTPNGSFFVWAAQDWNAAPYAVGIFALSGFSPVLDNWPGGGRAGIHGWRDTSVMGTQASHGCVRMAPSDFARLIHTVPLGTPVDIQQ